VFRTRWYWRRWWDTFHWLTRVEHFPRTHAIRTTHALLWRAIPELQEGRIPDWLPVRENPNLNPAYFKPRPKSRTKNATRKKDL